MGEPRQLDTARPEATPAEFKAMAHPLRLRILRLCLHEPMTNKQIADALGQDPATTLYHVRLLTRTGFLEAETPRAGPSGALEKPYRSTGKSWVLAVPRPEDLIVSALAAVDAVRAEIADAGPESLVIHTRIGVQLSADEIDELKERFDALIQEYADRPGTPGGTKLGLFVAAHRLA